MDFSTLNIIPGAVMGFREGLEAFLVISVMLEYLNRTGRSALKKNIWAGLAGGAVLSLAAGGLLYTLTLIIGRSAGEAAALWESGASLAALLLITLFIISMMGHTESLKERVGSSMNRHFSSAGLLTLSMVLVAREGVEIVLFVFASPSGRSYLAGTAAGILLAAAASALIYRSLVMVNLALMFRITLIYLILQAGFMLGYAFHEYSAFVTADISGGPMPFMFRTLFNLSETVWDHEKGPAGMVIYLAAGWHSRPETGQFIIQYSYVILMLAYWRRQIARRNA